MAQQYVKRGDTEQRLDTPRGAGPRAMTAPGCVEPDLETIGQAAAATARIAGPVSACSRTPDTGVRSDSAMTLR